MVENQNPRQLALNALRAVYLREAYSDIALEQVLRQNQVNSLNRALACELVYGCVRYQRSLDALIDLLGKKKARQQPADLRIILHLGLYQLRYLQQIPPSAAVNTSVELTKNNKLAPLSGVVNALLRKYLVISSTGDPLNNYPLAVVESFPEWIVEMWVKQIGEKATLELCKWFNQTPTIDLRVNRLRSSLEEVETALKAFGLNISRVENVPSALRVFGGIGEIEKLPGFKEGWWMVQDSSAQLVTHLLAPQPGEVVIDACAAPGGKTTHIAELMHSEGRIIALDVNEKRLTKVKENLERLHLKSVSIHTIDSRQAEFQSADRVLVDAPCSGLGTLHKRPDIRWRQTLEKTKQLSSLQKELLEYAATWVKPGGILVYATCTLNWLENEAVIEDFLSKHSDWLIEKPSSSSSLSSFADSMGMIKLWPHLTDMDGFFMVKLRRN